MTIPILTGSLIAALMLLDWQHERHIARLKKRFERQQVARNAAIEYSNISRKEVIR